MIVLFAALSAECVFLTDSFSNELSKADYDATEITTFDGHKMVFKSKIESISQYQIERSGERVLKGIQMKWDHGKKTLDLSKFRDGNFLGGQLRFFDFDKYTQLPDKTKMDSKKLHPKPERRRNSANEIESTVKFSGGHSVTIRDQVQQIRIGFLEEGEFVLHGYSYCLADLPESIGTYFYLGGIFRGSERTQIEFKLPLRNPEK